MHKKITKVSIFFPFFFETIIDDREETDGVENIFDIFAEEH